jgi:uncharacterized protein (DUF1501 family)
MNREHAQENPGDTRLDARIASYELAAKLSSARPKCSTSPANPRRRKRSTASTRSAPNRSAATVSPRGAARARRALRAGLERRLGSTNNWDNPRRHRQTSSHRRCRSDKPAAALVQDLKARGMFEDTLIIWTTEFGRMPFSQGSLGRDHTAARTSTGLPAPA